MDEKAKNCCNFRGVGIAFVNGFCRAVNSLISCIKEKITKRQFFLLAGAAIAAIFKTRNVALSTAAGTMDSDEDNTPTESEESVPYNISSEIIETVIETAVDSVLHESSKNVM